MAYDRIKNDFLWLKDAGVVLPVYNVTEPKSPLIISEKRNLFKLFLSDVGLLTSQYPNITKLKILQKDSSINNGALFENVAAQELFAKGNKVYYYNNKKTGEIDFILELDGQVLPLEIKSGKDYKRHSALSNVLSNAYYGIEEAFVFGNMNLEVEGKKVYYPIYMLMFLEETKVDRMSYRLGLSDL